MSDSVILKQLYPSIDKAMKANTNKYKQCVGRFIEKRSKDLYDIAPYERIFFGQDDIDDLYKSIQINHDMIHGPLSKTYYYPHPNFNPRAAKDEFTIAVLSIIRYFYINKMPKELELSTIYLAFSGKFYPSVHSGSFPVCAPGEHKHIMEFVVNQRLSNKFDLKREGSLINAVKSICNTWLHKYEDRIKRYDDEDIVYLIQQLHDRIKSFMQNIAEEYYKLYKDKDAYMSYDSDDMSEDNFRLADNDSLKIERHVEKTMAHINSTTVDYKLCKMASDNNVKTDEVKSIIETILDDNTNLPIIKEFMRLTISLYFKDSKDKDIRDISFISKSIVPKPNSKDPDVLRQKEIVESWLNENSPAYRKRRSREATKSSYHKSIITYFVLLIHAANK